MTGPGPRGEVKSIAGCSSAGVEGPGLRYGRRVSGWACPHEDRGACRLLRRDCDPGIAGCVLHGRVRFAGDSAKNATPEATERAKRRVEKKRNR